MRTPTHEGSNAADWPTATAATAGHAVGNRAMSRLVSGGGDALRVQPSLVAVAGNRAVQRTLDPPSAQAADDLDDTQDYMPHVPRPDPSAATAAAGGLPNQGLILPPPIRRPPPAAESDDEAETPANRRRSAGLNPLADAATTAAALRRPAQNTNTLAADHPAFEPSTKGLDATSGAAGLLGFADNVGITSGIFGDSAQNMAEVAGYGDVIPGVNAGLNALGAWEAHARMKKHDRNRDVMEEAGEREPGADTRAAEILRRGAGEQDYQGDRNAARAALGGTQTALGITGIVTGVTTGGTLPLAMAGAIGAGKFAETVHHQVRKRQGAETRERHAQQLLFAAAQGEDTRSIAALDALGVPTTNLQDPDTWKEATDSLGKVMSNDAAPYQDQPAAGQQPAAATHQPGVPGRGDYSGISHDEVENRTLLGQQPIGPLEHMQLAIPGDEPVVPAAANHPANARPGRRIDYRAIKDL